MCFDRLKRVDISLEWSVLKIWRNIFITESSSTHRETLENSRGNDDLSIGLDTTRDLYN